MVPYDDKDTDQGGDQGEGGKGGEGGGRSGQIEFRDFLAPGERRRDDQLSGDEKRRLLSNHKDLHESRVRSQKDLRDQRKDLKNGKIPLQSYRNAISAAGMSSGYKPNPILANAAQFSGKDRQVNTLPTENVETNKADQDELRLKLGMKLEAAPKFNPRPQFP